MTIDEVADTFGISCPSVIKILNQYQVDRWSKRQLFSPDLDEDYFSEIDSQEKAYFLGLITTDGCVFWITLQRAILVIELKKKDAYILERFMAAIRCNRKLSYSERSDTMTATVTSPKMVRDLEKYGIHPRSSLTQKFWEEVPPKYLASYLRGIIDGDGSFGFYARPGRKVHKKQLCICSGCREFLEGLIKTVGNAIGISQPTIFTNEQKNVSDIRWSGNDDLETIITFLYSTGGPWLTRKQEVASRILQEIRQYRDNGHKAAS